MLFLYLQRMYEFLVVVTVDGILLTKSGTMTGGTSGGMEARSHKWDDKKIEGLWSSLSMLLWLVAWFWTIRFVGLKKKKEGLESEFEKLGSIREMQLKESEASGKISGLEKKIHYAEIEKVIAYLFIQICEQNLHPFSS